MSKKIKTIQLSALSIKKRNVGRIDSEWFIWKASAKMLVCCSYFSGGLVQMGKKFPLKFISMHYNIVNPFINAKFYSLCDKIRWHKKRFYVPI